MNDPTRGSAQPPGPSRSFDDDATLRAYGEAAAQAGEAPRADTRAAILAAAARHVQARPQPVGHAAPTLKRYRAPLALAASLLIGTIAWQLAAQFDEPAIGVDTVQEVPSAVAPVAAPLPPAATAEPSSAAARSVEAPREQPVAPQREELRAPPAPTGDADMTRKPARDERALASTPAAPAAPPAAEAAPNTAQVPSQPPAQFPAQKPASAPPPPPAAAAPLAAPSSANGEAASAALRAAPPRPAALRMSPATSSPPGVGASAESPHGKSEAAPAEEQVRTQPVERRRYNEDSAPRPLAAWLAQVIELRVAGRDAEADRELQALRKHYPQAQIPPAALPAAER